MQIEKYVFVTIESKEEYSDNIVGILCNFPIQGIEEKNDTFIVTFKEGDWKAVDYEFFVESVKLVDPNASIRKIETIEDRNWNEEWEKNLMPVIVSKKVAVVPFNKLGTTGKQIELVIDPKMSFGTGHHASTRIMIKLAEKFVQPGSFWIDVGTGTGILAILARKLGAREVLAIDNSSWAIENATENIKNNNISSGIDLIEMDIDTLPELPIADGILANLNYDIIVRNLKKFYNSVEMSNGIVIVSGVLIYDFDDFEFDCVKNNFTLIEVLKEEEWFGAVLIPRANDESSSN